MDLNKKNCAQMNETIDALKLQVKRGCEFFKKTIDIFAEVMAKFGDPQTDIDEFVLEHKTRFAIYTAFGDGTDNENQNRKGPK